jgi:SAM-dependent methyltransferase
MNLPVVCPDCGQPLSIVGRTLQCTSCPRIYDDLGRDMWRLTIGSSGSPGYDPEQYAFLAEVEDDHYWFVSRRECLLDALRGALPDLGERALFDVGCGTGSLLGHLAQNGVRVAGGCDAYVEGLAITRRRTDAPLFLVDEGRRPPLACGQTLIGLFDVLEHIDDDEGTLRWLQSVLEPGGVLALTVPAHPLLWGVADVIARHRRRYRRGELRRKLESAGFRILRLTHFMASLAPPLAVLRTLERTVRVLSDSAPARRHAELEVHAVINGALRAVLALERHWLRIGGSFPFGSSLLAIAQRP